MTELFRKEAINHATRRLAGEVILATSVPTRILTALLCLVVLGAAIVASTASYARKPDSITDQTTIRDPI